MQRRDRLFPGLRGDYATDAILLTISRSLPSGLLSPKDVSAAVQAAMTCPSIAMGAMSSSILRILSPRRLISKLSVRARVIAITLIPVLGFLAIGIAYIAGERA